MERKFGPRFISRQDRVLAGEKHLTLVASPGPGADWSVSVPGGRQWRLNAFTARLTTSAAVANRIPRLQYGDGTTVFWEGGQTLAVTAGIVQRISGAVNGPQALQAAANIPSLLFLPDLILPPQSTIAFSTVAIDGADQWSNVVLFVEEFWASDQAISNRHYAYERAEQLAAEQAAAQIGVT